MLYILSLYMRENGEFLYYRVYETSSESVMLILETELKNIILNSNIQVVNASIQNNEIKLNSWANGVASQHGSHFGHKFYGSKYVLLAMRKDTYKISDYEGNVFYIGDIELKALIKSKQIANCIITETAEGSKLIAKDVYEIIKDKEFEQDIDSRYKNFLNKAIMIGYKDMTFDYSIENHVVKLRKYTGSNKNVLLPSFITAIVQDAFKNTTIEAIRFSTGLKVIGQKAFATHGKSKGVDRVELPETVDLVGIGAFMENVKLFKSDGNINSDRFKIHNDKTIILTQTF